MALSNRALADSFGIRYIQIPIGYDKVPREAALDMLDAKPFDPDKAPEPASFAERMSAIDRMFDELKKMGADTLEAKGNALALEENFGEIHRLKVCRKCDSAAYGEMRAMSDRFQRMRRTGDFSDGRIKEAETSCSHCHERIRN